MKRLEETLPIGPKEAEELRQAGVETLSDLAKPQVLQDLSVRTTIPLPQIRQLHDQAGQKLRAARHWRIAAVLLTVVAAVVIFWYSRHTTRSIPSPETLGEQYYDKAQYLQAIQEFNKAIQADPKNKYAYANRGGALRRLGRTQEAVDSLNQALALDPKDVWALTERATAYEDLAQYEKALQDSQAVVALDPKQSYAFGNEAFSLRRLGRYPEALAAINKDIELDPKDAWSYNERALIEHDNLHQYELAYEDDKKAAQLAPDNLDYQMNLAEAALTTGYYQEASGLAMKILADGAGPGPKQLNVSSQMSMRFIVISALLLQRRTTEANAKLQEFVAYYKSVPSSYERQWDYSGDREYINGLAMDSPSKNIIVDLTQLLDPKPSSTIENTQKLIAALSVN